MGRGALTILDAADLAAQVRRGDLDVRGGASRERLHVDPPTRKTPDAVRAGLCCLILDNSVYFFYRQGWGGRTRGARGVEERLRCSRRCASTYRL